MNHVLIWAAMLPSSGYTASYEAQAPASAQGSSTASHVLATTGGLVGPPATVINTVLSFSPGAWNYALSAGVPLDSQFSPGGALGCVSTSSGTTTVSTSGAFSLAFSATCDSCTMSGTASGTITGTTVTGSVAASESGNSPCTQDGHGMFLGPLIPNPASMSGTCTSATNCSVGYSGSFSVTFGLTHQ